MQLQHGNDAGPVVLRWRKAVCMLLCACGMVLAWTPARAQMYGLTVWNEATGAAHSVACHSLEQLQLLAALLGAMYPLTNANITVHSDAAFEAVAHFEVVRDLDLSLNHCLDEFALAGDIAMTAQSEARLRRLQLLLLLARIKPLPDVDNKDGDGHGPDPGPDGAGAAAVSSGATSARHDAGADDPGEGASPSAKKPRLGHVEGSAAARCDVFTVAGINVPGMRLARAANASQASDLGAPLNFLSCPAVFFFATTRPASGAGGVHRSAW
jgi:hypothetical protein